MFYHTGHQQQWKKTDVQKPRTHRRGDRHGQIDKCIYPPHKHTQTVSHRHACRDTQMHTFMLWLHVKRNYFKIISAFVRRRPSEIVLFRHVETCLKSFQNFSLAYCSSRIFYKFTVAEIIQK